MGVSTTTASEQPPLPPRTSSRPSRPPPHCSKEFTIVSGLDDNNNDDTDDAILKRYDGFLVDQWGVMHNGQQAMVGARECIAKLAHSPGKHLVILSNSPSSEAETLQALRPLGFDPNHFSCGAVTSGVLAGEYVTEQVANGKFRKALCMGWKHPAAPAAQEFLKRCGPIELVTSVQDGNPDVLIVQGNEILLGSSSSGGDDATGQGEQSLGDFLITGKTNDIIDPILKDCVDRSIPLVCVDPDFQTVNPDGSVLYMPGTIAKRYEALGGSCLYFGKPYAPGFDEGIRRLRQAGVTDLSRMAMIGDSLHHDVAGATAVGLDSILVLGGVHRTDLGNALGEVVDRKRLQELFAQHGQYPTIVAPLLKLTSSS